MSEHKPWSAISEKLRADVERRVRIEEREKAIAEGLTIGRKQKGHRDPGSRQKKDSEAGEK